MKIEKGIQKKNKNIDHLIAWQAMECGQKRTTPNAFRPSSHGGLSLPQRKEVAMKNQDDLFILCLRLFAAFVNTRTGSVWVSASWREWANKCLSAGKPVDGAYGALRQAFYAWYEETVPATPQRICGKPVTAKASPESKARNLAIRRRSVQLAQLFGWEGVFVLGYEDTTLPDGVETPGKSFLNSIVKMLFEIADESERGNGDFAQWAINNLYFNPPHQEVVEFKISTTDWQQEAGVFRVVAGMTSDQEVSTELFRQAEELEKRAISPGTINKW